MGVTADNLDEGISSLIAELERLRDDVVADAEKRLAPCRDYFPDGNFSISARNLAHYLSLRRYDLRPLQGRLTAWGLSSLGRGEPNVLLNLDRVLSLLRRVAGVADHGTEGVAATGAEGPQILLQHTEQLFGSSPGERSVHIMVTLASEAAWNLGFVKSLLDNGMDCARINCAHDGPDAWRNMVDNVRLAAQQNGRPCKILMDLAGHKIRTGPVVEGPAVMHVKPQRDAMGRVISPAVIGIEADSISEDEGVSAVPRGRYRLAVPQACFDELVPDGRLSFTDVRGKHRYLRLVERIFDRYWLAHCDKSAYLAVDTLFAWQCRGADGHYHTLGEYPICPFAGRPLEIPVFQGERLLLSKDGTPGRPAVHDQHGSLREPARISCTLPEVVERLQPGDDVWIDDGKLGAVVEELTAEGAVLRVENAAPNGVRIGPGKGLNFPDLEMQLPPLSVKDEEDLDFVCRHADMVGFSFVETVKDMDCLIAALDRREARHLPIIAKIETHRAVRKLPELLLGTMGRQALGVMIARGDLAVELGSVRLAEIQEEILWLCEAAHVPVIWATQVLETLTKKGGRSRPEFTDAAMGVRAECVMLNKGPYILQALRALNNVLVRMEAHQHKKISRLRALHW
ncbi:MAG: pyruvate kinase [Gammaproteobacteria bacterium]